MFNNAILYEKPVFYSIFKNNRLKVFHQHKNCSNNNARVPFSQVPLVPLIPCMSILLNIYLMMKLDIHTWIRFGIWLLIGLFIYVLYSMKHSVEGRKQLQEEPKKRPSSTAAVHPISIIKL